MVEGMVGRLGPVIVGKCEKCRLPRKAMTCEMMKKYRKHCMYSIYVYCVHLVYWWSISTGAAVPELKLELERQGEEVRAEPPCHLRDGSAQQQHQQQHQPPSGIVIIAKMILDLGLRGEAVCGSVLQDQAESPPTPRAIS